MRMYINNKISKDSFEISNFKVTLLNTLEFSMVCFPESQVDIVDINNIIDIYDSSDCIISFWAGPGNSSGFTVDAVELSYVENNDRREFVIKGENFRWM